MLDDNRTELLNRLNANWPKELKFTLNEGRIAGVENHLLSGELLALERGEVVSLPFFGEKGQEVRWFTAARNPEDLRLTIEKLRCWILPSFAWEEADRPIVTPGSESGHLGQIITSFFSAGYFRWRTTTGGFRMVVEKLRAMRILDALKPTYVFDRTPSLFELRQQYAIALGTGDREAATEAVRLIDYHQLDKAVNTAFMRVRLWDQFQEYQEIVDNQDVRELVRWNLPYQIRLCITRAYHAFFLSRHEDRNDLASATQAYHDDVHPVLSGLIRSLRSEDGLEVRRCLAYLANHENDPALAWQVLDRTDDLFLASLLEKIPSQQDQETISPVDIFYRAMQQEDWRTLQEVGFQLLHIETEEVPPTLCHALPSILLNSLNHLPNQELMRELASHATGVIEYAFIAPQNWYQFLDAISTRQWDGARQFLNVDRRPLLTELSLTDTYQVLDTLEELLTDPTLTYDHDGYEVANETLSAFIEDFVKQESFPQKSYVDVYLRILQLWSAYKTGSAKTSDGQLLLALAYAVLLYRGDEKDEISGAIRQWWQTRKVRALAPFLLEALELLAEYTPVMSVCENLWIELAGLIHLDPTGYSPGEKSLLRQIGRRLNINGETIDQFLKVKPGSEDKSEDILSQAGIGKVAIVSLHEKAASLAAKIIKERTKASVVLVTEKDAGPQTKNAKSANVILFVWSASKHTVYRAFDDVRDKLAYVQGVGATSIVLALERWVIKNRGLLDMRELSETI